MRIVIICMGWVFAQPCPHVGLYLTAYDPDGDAGRGTWSWSPDAAEAMAFTTVAAAWACWQAQSLTAPVRADGQSNRPLTMFTVSIEGVAWVARG